MLILKFGGTSVGNPQRMQQVASLITAINQPKIVVLSAVAGTTNALVQLGKLLLAKQTEEAAEHIDKLEQHYQAFIDNLLTQSKPRQQAQQVLTHSISLMRNYLGYPFGRSKNNELLAQGELLSTQLFSLFLTENKIDNTLLSALDFMHLTPSGEPDVQDIKQKLTPMLRAPRPGTIYITQGFICLNSQGDIDNLKRGGSDYTASLIGAAVQANEIQIWTDIDGMHNNDPRLVKATKPIEHLSFDEAAELAYFGAKILHPATILPAQVAGVPVRLKNTLQPEAPGTLINKDASHTQVKAVAAKDGITAIKIKSSRMLLAHGFLLKIFQIFDYYKTAIDMVTTSEIAVSLTIDDTTHLTNIVEELQALGQVEVDKNQSIICLVGNQILKNQQVLQQLFKSMEQTPLRMVSLGGSKNNISLLVPSQQKQVAMASINKGVFGL